MFAPIKVEVKGAAKIVKFLKVSCGKKHSMAIDSNGSVYSTGDN